MTNLQDGLMMYDEWITSVEQHVPLEDMSYCEILTMYFDDMDKIILEIGINALATQNAAHTGKIGAKEYDD